MTGGAGGVSHARPRAAKCRSRRVDSGRWGRGGWVVLACGVALGACEQESVDERPERVVQEFIRRMQRVHGDPQASRAAYELLWAEGRQNLAERAKRASAVTGQKIAPEEMIAPSRFWMRDGRMKLTARVAGDWAEVSVTTETPGGSEANTVRCVAEDGRWRVAIALPPLPPIERRLDRKR